MTHSEPDITFERPKSAQSSLSSLNATTEPLPDDRTPLAGAPHQQEGAPTKQRTKRNVRFLITEGGDVVSESVRFEKHGMPRSKATEALECLLAGNERFRKGGLERCRAGPDVVAEAAGDAPKPSTVILACSDSRVPPELICDQGLGDCHVVRVAGNVVNDFVMGSVLFAVQNLGCRLVLVLGHSRCSVVASAVQTWARQKSLTKEGQSVRTLAEGVQQTLSSSNSNNSMALPDFQESISPFHEQAKAALEDHESAAIQSDHEPSKPSFFARLCGNCGCGSSEDASAYITKSSDEQVHESSAATHRRSSERNVGRGSVSRSSINPLNLLVGAMSSAVETVANSGEHESFRALVNKESRGVDNGWDSDDEDLKRGLAKQDSIEFTRARLAKSKADRKIEQLRELACRADVDSVIDENSKVSAATILKSLVKNVDPSIVSEIEVAAGKYDIENGSLRVLSRSWYANKTFFCTLED